MKTSRNLLILPVLAATLFTFGCGRDSTGPPDVDNRGTLAFTFTDGQTSSSFNASGEVQLGAGAQPQFGTWAAGGHTTTNDLIVGAFRGRTAPRGDVAIVFVPNITAPRSATITEACLENNDDCPFMYFVLNASLDNVDLFDRICLLVSGTITVSALSNQRAQGTFSGAGVCATSEFTNPQLFSVSNGTFDVPIVPNFDFE